MWITCRIVSQREKYYRNLRKGAIEDIEGSDMNGE